MLHGCRVQTGRILGPQARPRQDSPQQQAQPIKRSEDHQVTNSYRKCGVTTHLEITTALPQRVLKDGPMLFDEKKFRANLPAEMLLEKRFVRFFVKPKPGGKGTAKIPLGNHSDPATWSTFDECVKQLENDQQGIGYNFLGGDIHGLDIDHCRNPKTGKLCNEAMLLLSRLPSWAEYSVSGCGIHVLFKGNVRGRELTETCLQYWNPKNSPRFFALTCDMVGDAFKQVKDVGDEFNYIFSTARHISAKIREELKVIDPEQWSELPEEREHKEEVKREKQTTKTRKLHQDFKLEEFLNFYGLEVDNVAKNSIGQCYRLRSCPIKGEPHVGQNQTTTNFILSADGGLGFHCQSTGCVDYGVMAVIQKLAEDRGPYPGKIYVEEKASAAPRHEAERDLILLPASRREKKHTEWLWPGYLTLNTLIHGAGKSAEGKSPLTLSLAATVTRGDKWPDGSENTRGPRSVILMASEDDWDSVIIPRLDEYGANKDLILEAQSVYRKGDQTTNALASLNRDIELLSKRIAERGDVSLVIIDPITNYLEGLSMNKEQEMRGMLMPLADMAQRQNVCVLTIGHLNKRGADASTLFEKVMGAAAFIGVARQTLFFTADPDDDNKFAHIMGLGRKTNYPAMKYKTKSESRTWAGKASDVVTVEWTGSSHADMEEAAVNPQKASDKSAAKEVRTFLKAFLRDGAKSTRSIEEGLKEAGIEITNWQRAAKKVAKSTKTKGKDSHTEWFLPTPDQLKFDGEQ